MITACICGGLEVGILAAIISGLAALWRRCRG